MEREQTSRLRLSLLALAALLAFVGVAGALAWKQYRDAQRTALHDSQSRAVVAAAVFNAYFAGELGTLSSIADAAAVVHTNEAGMLAYFKRVQPRNGTLFSGGLLWVDRTGTARVSSARARPGSLADVSDRAYFTVPINTGKPYVSAGLTTRKTNRQVVAMSTPTRDARGRITGVLVGSLLIKSPRNTSTSLDLGYAGLAIIDRNGQSLLDDLVHPRGLPAARIVGVDGVLSNVRGLDGGSGHTIAYARATVPGWTIILDRSRGALFASARRSLVLEIVLIAGVGLVDLVLLGWVIARMRSQAQRQLENARRDRDRYEIEHQVATTLQRSLLAQLPEIAALDGAARYQAGSTGLEVGGDWYDVVHRGDGIIHISVGDVAGHGVAATALMGQLRHAFRAYSHDNVSPRAIIRGLLRHLGEGEMATAVCIAVDREDGVLTYASAGHPPPMLRDDDSGLIVLLDGAQAAPLGFADPGSIREARVALPTNATLVAYTDGVVERRDQPIDRGIERLEASLRAASPSLSAADLAERIIHDVAEVTAADDDVALLVVRLLDPGPRETERRDGLAAAAGPRV